METITQRLGARVRSLRQRIGYTQELLAQKAGLSPQSIGRIEQGRYPPSLGAIERLARALGVPEAAILDFDGTYGGSADAAATLIGGLPADPAEIRRRVERVIEALAGKG